MDVQPVTELARAVIAQVAPGEMLLFGAMSRAYAADPSRARMRRGRDETLGFGVAEAASLLTPVVLVAAHQVADYLAEDFSKSIARGTADAVAKRVAKLFRREPDTLPLTQAQLSRIRAIAVEVARTAAIPEAQSSLIADALVGHLASTPAAP